MHKLDYTVVLRSLLLSLSLFLLYIIMWYYIDDLYRYDVAGIFHLRSRQMYLTKHSFHFPCRLWIYNRHRCSTTALLFWQRGPYTCSLYSSHHMHHHEGHYHNEKSPHPPEESSSNVILSYYFFLSHRAHSLLRPKEKVNEAMRSSQSDDQEVKIFLSLALLYTCSSLYYMETPAVDCPS